MRVIKFRGKSLLNNNWVYGNLIQSGSESFIVNGVIECNSEYIALEDWTPVGSESVGQFTGLKDKNMEDIYEGDVLEVISSGTALGAKFYEGFQGYDSKIHVSDICYIPFRNYTSKLTVIGNVYENPELI